MLIISYFLYTTVVKISENKTPFQIAAQGLQSVKMDPFINFSKITCACVQNKQLTSADIGMLRLRAAQQLTSAKQPPNEIRGGTTRSPHL